MKIIFYGDSLTEGNIGASFIDKIKKRYPKNEIINFGKNGDTVISLYKRIIKNDLDISSDLAFIWIGTNDVFVKVSGLYYPIKVFSNQRPSKDHDQFCDYYQKVVKIISKKAKKVVSIPPIFVGENLENKWNLEIKELSKHIENISDMFSNVQYFDLRTVFVKKLKNKVTSDYVTKNFLTTFSDYIKYNNPKEINKISDKRGLFFTLDGIHLNEKGAKIVTEEFSRIIDER